MKRSIQVMWEKDKERRIRKRCEWECGGTSKPGDDGWGIDVGAGGSGGVYKTTE